MPFLAYDHTGTEDLDTRFRQMAERVWTDLL